MVFAEKYGDTLTKQLKIFLGDGMTTTFNYIKYERKIHGLHIFFKKYDVLDGYVIFFDYIGDSSFKVSIYDSQNTNHLRHCDGGYRFEDSLYHIWRVISFKFLIMKAVHIFFIRTYSSTLTQSIR